MPDVIDQLGDGTLLSLAQSASRFSNLNDNLLRQIGSFGDVGSAVKSTSAITDIICGKDDNVLQQYFSAAEREALDSMASLEYWLNVENLINEQLNTSGGFTLQDGQRFLEAFNEASKAGIDSFNYLLSGDLSNAGDSLTTLGGSLQEISRVLSGIPGFEGLADDLNDISGKINDAGTIVKDVQNIKSTVLDCRPSPPKLPTFDTIREKYDSNLQKISDLPVDQADQQNSISSMSNSQLRAYKEEISESLNILSGNHITQTNNDINSSIPGNQI